MTKSKKEKKTRQLKINKLARKEGEGGREALTLISRIEISLSLGEAEVERL